MAMTPEEIQKMFESAFKEADISVIPTTERVSVEPIKATGVQNSGIEPVKDGVLVPALSKQELAENVPPNGKKMVMVKTPPGISNETFKTLLSNTYALYVTQGTYSNEELQKRTGYAEGIIAKTLSTSEFRYALKVRGVEPTATGLTVEQDYALLVLTDPSDNRTLSQKLKLLNISYAKFRAWMQQPIFKAHIDSVAGSILNDNTASLIQLERLAGNGDLSAIKYKHELNGLYNPNKQNNIDIMALMALLFEVVSRHVKPGPELLGIAEDLKQIASDLKLNGQQLGQ